MNHEEMKKHISEKQDAIRNDAFAAKQNYEDAKGSFDSMSVDDDYEEYYRELGYLRHEMKLLMSLLTESKFDEIIYLMSNPSKLMGLNFVIGFVRGLGFALAVLIILLLTLISLADTPIFYFL